MEILALAFLGGIVGAVLMDITETYAAKVGITSGVNVALVGRWFLGLLRGRFTHSDIRDSQSSPQEVKAGWAFHFLVGGGGVALIYPLFFQAAGLSPSRVIICLAACSSDWLRRCCLGSFFCLPSAGAFSAGVDREAQTPCLQALFLTSLMVSGLGR